MPIEAAPPMSDNEALRQILSTQEGILNQLASGYDSIEGDNQLVVALGVPVIIPADAHAKKRVITNLTGNRVQIRESGALVGIILQYQTWESALNGGGEITLTAVGGNVTVATATYLSSI